MLTQKELCRFCQSDMTLKQSVCDCLSQLRAQGSTMQEPAQPRMPPSVLWDINGYSSRSKVKGTHPVQVHLNDAEL